MRRFVTLAVLLFFAIPFGISVSGCKKALAPTYCNGEDSGVQVGQLTSLDLEPRLTGISLNQGEIGRVNSPSGKDCRGNSASASNVVFASTNINLADVAPTTGSLCAGSWNRNTGAGIADYTVCTPAATNGIAFVTASSSGVVSNPIPVFIHPTVTSIVLGPASTNCTTDPASNCVDLTQATACDSGPVLPGTPAAVTAYDGLACVSQGNSAQLVARTYTGNGTAAANNISCLVGPITFTALNSSVLTIANGGTNGVANGLATAAEPGSSAISAATSQAASTAGFFNTCPPASIVLSVPPNTTAPTAPVSVNQNTAQPFTATVFDTNVSTAYPLGHPITNITLQYISTSPTTIPTNSASVTPTYPGAAAITAICQPPTCNPAPFNEIGLFGNGTPITSNPVQISAAGTNFSTVLYIASKESQYLLPIDFTVSTQPPPVRLPYAPNSMVMSEDQSTLYMGTAYEIMSFSTGSNAIVKQDTSVSGTVLAIADDNSTLVITDPVRQLIYLYNSGGGIATQYGGVATSAQFTPDSSTVYITTSDGRLLVHSTFTGWSSIPLTGTGTDVAVTIPNAGVYIAGNPVDVRTNCPATTVLGSGLAQTTTNTFYPDLGPVAGVNAISLAATNDGAHILTANTTSFTDIATNQKSGNCPVTFKNSPGAPISIASLGAISTPNAVTSSYTPNQVTPNILTTSDSAFAFLSYQVAAGSVVQAVVPQYSPATGTLTNLTLNPKYGTPTAPVAEVLTADNTKLFVGTSGDNVVHVLIRGTSGFSEQVTTNPIIVPALPNINGTGTATPDLLAQRPRKATS